MKCVYTIIKIYIIYIYMRCLYTIIINVNYRYISRYGFMDPYKINTTQN